MSNSVTIFILGITGVFFGMAMLYLSIKITAAVLDKFQKKEEQN
ncbi:MAG: hypothetical protein V1793_18100 [Pseudomonadota bacterium]